MPRVQTPKCLLRKFARNSPRVESQVSLQFVLYGRYLSRLFVGRTGYCLMAFLRSFSKFNSVCSSSPLFLQFWRVVVAFTTAMAAAATFLVSLWLNSVSVPPSPSCTCNAIQQKRGKVYLAYFCNAPRSSSISFGERNWRRRGNGVSLKTIPHGAEGGMVPRRLQCLGNATIHSMIQDSGSLMFQHRQIDQITLCLLIYQHIFEVQCRIT